MGIWERKAMCHFQGWSAIWPVIWGGSLKGNKVSIWFIKFLPPGLGVTNFFFKKSKRFISCLSVTLPTGHVNIKKNIIDTVVKQNAWGSASLKTCAPWVLYERTKVDYPFLFHSLATANLWNSLTWEHYVAPPTPLQTFQHQLKAHFISKGLLKLDFLSQL